MQVAETPALIPYKAFTIEEGRPPAFVVHAHDEASVFPYEHLIGVGWLKSDARHQLFVEHRFFSLYLHGDNLQPLLEGFWRFAVGQIHVFDAGHHVPVAAGKSVITHIDDHYENEGGKNFKLPAKR
jgi:hypothetical protein